MASVVSGLLVPGVYATLVIYAALLVIVDLSFALAIATLGLVVSVIIFLKFSLPFNDETSQNEFFHVDPAQLIDMTSSKVRVDINQHGQGSSYSNERPTKVFTVSHRTTALEAPENSISGIREAKTNGFHAVEFDVRLTKDGIPVLFHDATVDRTTDGFGNLNQITLNELRKLDISAKHLKHENFKGERVPTLDEAIEECLKLQLKMFIEIKAPTTKVVLHLLELFKNNKELKKQAIIICWSPLFLYQVRRSDPSILASLVWRPQMLSTMAASAFFECGRSSNFTEVTKHIIACIADVIVDWAFHSVAWYLCGISVVLAQKDVLSKAYLRYWNERGVTVLAWTVNDPFEKQYFSNVLGLGYLSDTYVPRT